MDFRLIVVVIATIACVVKSETDSGSALNLLQKKHSPKSLTTAHLRKVALKSDTKEAEDNFKKILKPMLRTRVPDTEGNAYVQEHIKDHMSSLGWEVEDDRFMDTTPLGVKNFNNIIATHNPDANRKLVLACHHDSKYFVNQEFIGATDSAVPCAMMIDLALQLNDTLWRSRSKMQEDSDLTLQFMFFDGEEAFVRWSDEDSTYGARHLAAKLKSETVVLKEEEVEKIDLIDAMVLLDLIGTKGVVFKNWFLNTEKHFERLQRIEQKLAKEKLLSPAQYFSAKSNKYFVGTLLRYGGIQDDHVPFMHAGVPILHLISHPFPDVWHKMSDNEAALDYETIFNIGKILRPFVLEYLRISPV